jgi:uncharacterized protein
MLVLSMQMETAPHLDKPWRRPGAAAYGLSRLRQLSRRSTTVYEAQSALAIDRDVAITMRDGTTLRANVYRPLGAGKFPVLLSAHPYGKDALPVQMPLGHRVSIQYRVLRQTARVRFSTLTGWEAPDPAWWAAQGYAIVNCDLRGAGTSGGESAPLSDQEGEDVYDLIEWAGAQPWSTGRVGLLGVSYLAMSQWKAAALRPPSLKAMCPWEGFTDAYRDLFMPGGIREDGFVKQWAKALKNVRLVYDLAQEQRRRPLRDEWWQSLVPRVDRIEVPILICASFSDNNLHSRGSLRGFEQVGSTERFLYTHRSGKWATFYSASALQTQLAFFDRYLRQRDVAPPPRVRLEVRESRDQIVEVREESDWPLERTQWTPLFLTSRGLSTEPATEAAAASFNTASSGIRFGWNVPADTELTGPMSLRLFVEVVGVDDIDLMVGVEKWRGTTYVPFEGSYGFGRDRVSTGWQKASLRALDPVASRTGEPVPTLDEREPLRPGEIVPVDIAIGPSATLFRGGEHLRLVIAGRWLWPTNLLTGQFPAAYAGGAHGRCILHWGPDQDSRLLVPVIPNAHLATGSARQSSALVAQ